MNIALHRTFLVTALALAAPLWGQQFQIGGKDVQMHGWFQQGFATSTNNNFLTMRTRGGSFSMTDGGLNLSSRITPKLRVGVQAFSRNIGDLGNGQVQVDWAFADYKFNDWLGVRGGKVKTVLGLFNETQDMEFVHTWALLPQSVYPTDLRASTIAHVGGDLYGDISLRKAGRLSYTLYAGRRPDDQRGGYYKGIADSGSVLEKLDTWARGGDVRWTTPLEGLQVGYSYFNVAGTGDLRLGSFGGLQARFDVTKSDTHAYYGDFQKGKLRAYGEFWLYDSDVRFQNLPIPATPTRNRSWYVATSYRLHTKVEVGAYYNDLRVDRNKPFAPDNGLRGPVLSARLDVNKYWNIKAETHFVDGFGTTLSFRTFYPSSNPQGLRPNSILFLMRTGFAF